VPDVRTVFVTGGADANAILAELSREIVLLDGRTPRLVDLTPQKRGRSFGGLPGSRAWYRSRGSRHLTKRRSPRRVVELPLALQVIGDYLLGMSKMGTPKGNQKPALRSGPSRARGGVNRVKFGNVVVTTTKPESSAVAENVVRSSEALERIAKKLVNPGFSVRPRQDVPRFSVDPSDPKLFVRQLNGRTERGRLVNGRFEVID
jgi:hypothetical protein